MKYLSIDVETSGLDPENDQILSFAAVLEDTLEQRPVEELPHFYAIMKHERIYGDPYALTMNATLIEMIANPDCFPDALFIRPGDLHYVFSRWAQKHFDIKHRITAAGKNFAAFDRPFIETLFKSSLSENIFGTQPLVKFSHRSLDPGPIFFDPAADKEVPNLARCLERSGLEPTVTHVALDDARDVIRVLRHAYRAKEIVSVEDRRE